MYGWRQIQLYRNLSGNLGCYLGNQNCQTFFHTCLITKVLMLGFKQYHFKNGLLWIYKDSSLKCFMTSPRSTHFLANDIIPSFYVTNLYSILYAQYFPSPTKLWKTSSVHKSATVKCDQMKHRCVGISVMNPNISLWDFINPATASCLTFLGKHSPKWYRWVTRHFYF